jgi:hypothetical protein
MGARATYVHELQHPEVARENMHISPYTPNYDSLGRQV